MDADGMRIDGVLEENAVREGGGPGAESIYMIPNFQNPGGDPRPE